MDWLNNEIVRLYNISIGLDCNVYAEISDMNSFIKLSPIANPPSP